DLAGEGGTGAQVVAVGAAGGHHAVVAEGGGPPAQQGDLVAEPGQAVGQAVHQQFGAAGGGVGQVAVGEEDDPAGLWGERRRVRYRGQGCGARGVRRPGRGRERGVGRHVLGHRCSNSSRGAELCVGNAGRGARGWNAASRARGGGGEVGGAGGGGGEGRGPVRRGAVRAGTGPAGWGGRGWGGGRGVGRGGA